MSDQSQLQVTPKDENSSLTLSKARSDLVARGRRDAVMLVGPPSPEPTDVLSETARLAEEGHTDAQFALGHVYDHGQGVPQNCAEAAKWYRKAADQGHAEAQFALAGIYYDGEGVAQDYAEAIRWYRKAAEQGNADAQCGLGVMYANGQGIPQDHTEAVHWYRKAAEKGNADAQYNLGLAYGSGVGVAGDLTEAEKWYHKAADQEHAEAQFNLAFYYYSKDYIEAARLWRKAADKGHSEAQYWLGICYKDGEGVPQDYVLAHMWFNLSASNSVGEDQQRRAKARDDVARRLTPQQLAQAHTLARRVERLSGI